MGDYYCSFDRLRGQRLPYAIFFGYFLAWLQESDTCQCLSGNRKQHLIAKLRFTFLRPYKKDVHSHVLLSSFRPDIQVIVYHTGSGILNIDAVDQIDDAPIRQDVKEHGFGANRDHQCTKGHLV